MQALTSVAAASALETTPAALSGGNQQKLMFARALLADPAVLIADEPTRGVDVGAKRDLYELLVDLAGRGVADPAHLERDRGDPRARPPRRSSCAPGGSSPSSPATQMTEEAILAASFGRAPAAAA